MCNSLSKNRTGGDTIIKEELPSNDLNAEGEINSSSSYAISCFKHLANYQISKRRFKKDIVIDGILSNGVGKEDIIFEDCEFNNIKLTEIGCRSIRFIRCAIHGELHIFKGRIKKLYFRNCSLISHVLIEESVRQEEDFSIQFLETIVLVLKIIDTYLKKLEFSDVNSACNEIEFIRDSKVERLYVNCPIKKLKIRELPRISLSMEGGIEFIHLEKINSRILKIYEKEAINENNKSHLDDILLRYKSIVLASYKSFEKRKMFSEADICLFEIRRLGILVKKVTSHFLGKSFYSFGRFVVEDCFGWGILISNNIITSFTVILSFSLLYFSSDHNAQASNLGFIKCLEISFNRFFLIGSDEYNYSFFPLFDSLESILGVVLLTIFTGVLLRKVIR